MTLRKRILMASAAVAALTIGLATTAQATDLRVSGITLAPSTFSTGQAGQLLKIDALKTTALQTPSFFDTKFGFGDTLKTATTAGDMKAVGDKKANVTDIWAAVLPGTVGVKAKVRASTFELKTVINRAVHPAVAYAYMRFHSLGVGIG